MKQKETDILNDMPELKKMPYRVPEGYFGQFKTEACSRKAQSMGLWERLSPYAAVAAVFVFLVTTGTFILEKTTMQDDMTEEDYIMFSGNMMNTISYEISEDVQFANAEIDNEDVINYLIYSGITAEELEMSK